MMWMMVLFDLPTLTKNERRSAAGFRNFLLDQGFEMAQFSVYMRFCAGKEQVETHTDRIRRNLPKTGKISILGFTDKQYENMVLFKGRKQEPDQKNPGQYVLL